MILSYDDEDYYANTPNHIKIESDNNKTNDKTNFKRKQLEENLFAFENKKNIINLFPSTIEDEKDQSLDEEILKKISDLKIKNNAEKILSLNSNQNESFSLGEKFLSKEMLKLINSPQTVILIFL